MKAVELLERIYSPVPTSDVTIEENREGRYAQWWVKGLREWE